MDWAKFEEQAALYGGGWKQKPNCTRKRKAKQQIGTPRVYLKNKSNAFKANYDALKLFQKQLRQRPTNAEKRFKKILNEFFKLKAGTNRKQRIVIFQAVFMFSTRDGRGKGYIADFYLPTYRVIMEGDGDSQDDKQDYDQIRDDTFYRKKKIRTLRVLNTQTKDRLQCFSLLKFAVK